MKLLGLLFDVFYFKDQRKISNHIVCTHFTVNATLCHLSSHFVRARLGKHFHRVEHHLLVWARSQSYKQSLTLHARKDISTITGLSNQESNPFPSHCQKCPVSGFDYRIINTEDFPSATNHRIQPIPNISHR